MSYVVLARKLRPQRFEDLIGQETTARTLRNAILCNRVAHAFLFTGSRGVGKTSAARILTKALNCLDPQEGNPCGSCGNCVEITDNASPDVYEIDAASNRGIENIRELRDNVQYAPAHCKYKVYIIDEAHMLTLESFNALLKTLEEPPGHVKFILATTDPHKVPRTIISRCQRYDFVRVPVRLMADFLQKVITDEKLKMSRQALEMIARHAVGGMRDALTMIDQVLSFTGHSATDEEVIQILGLIDAESRFAFLESLIHKQADKAMSHFQSLQDHGHDVHDILAELIRSVKTMSVIQTLGTDTDLFQDLSPDDVATYARIAEEATADQLQQIFRILVELEERMKRSTFARICFEMALLQIVSTHPLIGLPELIREIRDLRQSSETPEPPQPTQQKQKAPLKNNPEDTSAATGLGPSGEAWDHGSELREPGSAPSGNYHAEEKSPAYGQKTAKSGNGPGRITSMLRGPGEKQATTVRYHSPAEKKTGTTPAVDPPKPCRESPASPKEEKTQTASDTDKLNSQVSTPPENWLRFSEYVQSHSAMLGGVIRNAVPADMNGETLVIGFKSGHPAPILSEENRKQLEKLAAEWTGKPIKLAWSAGQAHFDSNTVHEHERMQEEKLLQQKREDAKSHPLVKEILNVFSGSEIVDIRLKET